MAKKQHDLAIQLVGYEKQFSLKDGKSYNVTLE